MGDDLGVFDPRNATRTLETLRAAFDRVLPKDDARDCRENFDPQAFQELYTQTENCLTLLSDAKSFSRNDDAWIDVEACADGLFSALSNDFIPRLNRVIEETLPAPEVTADRAMALDASIRTHSPIAAKMFILLTSRSKDLTGHAAPPAWRADLEKRLGNLIRTYQVQINTILTSPDPPDLRNLSADLLRMDILYWTLQDLDIPTVADVLEKNEQVTVRLIMDSASDAVERFLKRPDNLNRFDLAIVLTAIDDLIAVMARVIEYHERDMERPHDGFLESRGRESITRFVGVMGRLMVMMFHDLGKQAEDGELPYEAFDINVTKIERIYEFCQLADPFTRGQVHSTAERMIREKSLDLVRKLEKLAQTNPSETLVRALTRLETALRKLSP